MPDRYPQSDVGTRVAVGLAVAVAVALEVADAVAVSVAVGMGVQVGPVAPQGSEVGVGVSPGVGVSVGHGVIVISIAVAPGAPAAGWTGSTVTAMSGRSATKHHSVLNRTRGDGCMLDVPLRCADQSACGATVRRA